jgi:hypothetical protein
MTSLAMNSGYRFESMQSSGMRQLNENILFYGSDSFIAVKKTPQPVGGPAKRPTRPRTGARKPIP